MSESSSFLAWMLPLSYLLAAALTLATPSRRWGIAQLGALAGLIGISGAVAVALVNHEATHDGAGLAVALLIALLGCIITRFSQHYLTGEAGQQRYVLALLLTLSAVGTVVLADHLVLLVAAWTASSLGLHHLLTFYRDRLPAQIAAHKKFLVSRLAEVLLVCALLLLHGEIGSLWLADINAAVRHAEQLTPALQVAVTFIALAVILKSAQLPLHGWLIQVMEAPTPVSALLHAGIVNIGGMVLIRLAEALSATPVAQAILVASGSLTAVLAGLVMMTRISIKVRLAWSTCAQMGFMLMECGLGLYDLALLHLVAHSLYKAHAFLTAGEAVLVAREHALYSPPVAHGWRALACRLLALPVAVAAVFLASQAAQQWLGELPLAPVAVLLAGIGLATLLWPVPGAPARVWGRNLLVLMALCPLYLLWHVAFGELVPTAVPAPDVAVAIWAGSCLLALYGVQSWLKAFPQGRLATRLYPWAYGGFFLDERFTRLSFSLWPLPRGSLPNTAASRPAPATKGEPA